MVWLCGHHEQRSQNIPVMLQSLCLLWTGVCERHPHLHTMKGYWNSHHQLPQASNPCVLCQCSEAESCAWGRPGSAGLAGPLSLPCSAGRATLTVCLRCINLLLAGAAVSSSSSTNSPLHPVPATSPVLCSSIPTDFNLLLSKLLIAICEEREMLR